MQLRAVTSLAQTAEGKQDRARALSAITSLLSWFIEGFDTPDFIAARIEATKGSRAKAKKVKAA